MRAREESSSRLQAQEPKRSLYAQAAQFSTPILPESCRRNRASGQDLIGRVARRLVSLGCFSSSSPSRGRRGHTRSCRQNPPCRPSQLSHEELLSELLGLHLTADFLASSRVCGYLVHKSSSGHLLPRCSPFASEKQLCSLL